MSRASLARRREQGTDADLWVIGRRVMVVRWRSRCEFDLIGTWRGAR